ncbi:MAG: zinc-ribbon domain-containing protein [Xanthobacteraceae bacterium]
MARIPNRSDPNRPVHLEQIVCPNCGKTYQIDVASLGRAGRSVRC